MALTLNKKQWVLSHVLLTAVLVLSLRQFFDIREAEASVTFLDVGQGDAILIQSKEGKNILIDTGPDGQVIERLSEKLNFFRPKIDLFILSHPDLDHYGGIMDILQKYEVKSIMITGVASSSELYLAFLDEVKKRNIPIIYPHQKEDWQIGVDLYLDILYPFNEQYLIGQEVKSKNDTSISLHIRNKAGESLLLTTGDAEEKQEKELLLSGQDFHSAIFALGHHGSKTSNSPNFLNAIKANTFVASSGKDNKFGHPHPEVLERLRNKTLLNTSEKGSLVFMLK